MRLLFSLVICIPVVTWIFKFKKNKDLLLPSNIYTLLFIVKIVAPTILLSSTTMVNQISNVYLRNAILNDKSYFIFILLEVLSYYLTIFGMNLVFKNIRDRKVKNEKIITKDDKAKYKLFGVLLYTIGVLAVFLIIRKIGGLNYFITNLQQRTIIMRNMDFLAWMLPFLSYGCILIVYSSKKEKLSFGTLLFATITGLIQGFGGRTTMIFLIIEIVFIFHYSVKNIDLRKIIKLKNIIGVMLLFLVFVTISSFRVPGAFDKFKDNPLEYVILQGNDVKSTLVKESYVPYYIMTIDYFKGHEKWYGSSFKGLLYALIPSSIYPSKPPVDDGTYLYSICLGRDDIKPVMSFKSLNISSYPLETFGSMYANFGLFGIVFGMIVLGYIIGYTYRKMISSNYTLFYVIAYVYILLGFELSTLRIFQTFEILLIFWIITHFIKLIKIKNKESFLNENSTN